MALKLGANLTVIDTTAYASKKKDTTAYSLLFGEISTFLEKLWQFFYNLNNVWKYEKNSKF